MGQIKVSDFRIGNYTNNGIVFGVNSGHIDCSGNYNISGMASFADHEIKPELITEEWLFKLGFEKVEDLGDMVYYKQPKNKGRGFGVMLDHEEWVFYLYTGRGYTPLIYDEEHFQYIHQLQNLYFSLTNTELK